MEIAVKSPCRGCAREFEDKNDPECVGCDKRMEYWQALGSLSSNVPDEMTDYVGKIPNDKFQIPNKFQTTNSKFQGPEGKMTEKQEKYETWQLKICKDPACDLAGKPQPIDAFGGSYRTEHGKKHICRSCQARRIKDGHYRAKSLRRKSGVKEEKLSSPNTTANTSEIIIPADPASRGRFAEASPIPASKFALTLDFSGFPQILEKIKTTAGEELRTVEMQTIYILKTVCRL